MRLTLAVATNRFDVFFDDAVLGDSIMIFDVFILSTSPRVSYDCQATTATVCRAFWDVP